MDMNSKDIGRIIKAARDERGWSQAQLGRQIGVKQASIYAIEAGETARSLAQLQLEFNVPIGFGLLTTDNLEQAEARAGVEVGREGGLDPLRFG